MRTFKELIISGWGSKANFARAVGVGYETARKWHDRNSIRPEHWDLVMSAARARGIRLTADDLLRMNRAQRRLRRREKNGRISSRAAA